MQALAHLFTWLAVRASQLYPDTYAADPGRAAYLAYCAMQVWADTDTHDERMTFIRSTEEWVERWDWPTEPLVSDLLPGQVLDGNATSAEPDVLTTTLTHQPDLLGKYRTYRHHVPVVDSAGNKAYSSELIRRADEILIRNGHKVGNAATGEVTWHAGQYRLAGTQDQSWPATVHHSPDKVLLNGTAVPIGQLPPPGVSSGNARRKPNGAVRGATTIGRQDKPRYATKPAQTVTTTRYTVTVPYIGQVPVINRLELLRVDYRGAHAIGHHPWQPNQTVRSKRTNAARARSEATQSTTTAEARTLAEHRALQLRTNETPENPPKPHVGQTRRSFKLRTERGVTITVALDSRDRFSVTIVPVTGKRYRTTTTAPQYVGAVVGNYLARCADQPASDMVPAAS